MFDPIFGGIPDGNPKIVMISPTILGYQRGKVSAIELSRVKVGASKESCGGVWRFIIYPQRNGSKWQKMCIS